MKNLSRGSDLSTRDACSPVTKPPSRSQPISVFFFPFPSRVLFLGVYLLSIPHCLAFTAYLCEGQMGKCLWVKDLRLRRAVIKRQCPKAFLLNRRIGIKVREKNREILHMLKFWNSHEKTIDVLKRIDWLCNQGLFMAVDLELYKTDTIRVLTFILASAVCGKGAYNMF